MFHALEHQNIKVATLLRARGAEVDSISLEGACYHGHAPVVDWLLANDANPNVAGYVCAAH